MSKVLVTAWGIFALVAALAADVWDVQTASDDSFATTENELVHGSVQLHDMAARPGPVADVDWYRIGQAPHSSYEITIDGVSGDIGPGPNEMERVAADGTTVLQTAALETAAFGNARSLRFVNTTAAAITDQFVRVRGAACTLSCTAADTYRIRARETTIRVARFNNSGTQITVLLTQNASVVPITANIYFWSTTGTLAATRTVTLGAKAMDVFNTSLAAAGVSGHLTVAHDGPHGGLNVKSVALEPSTGFSFDTPGVFRP